MSIGLTIKKLRRERDMTQEQLAEYLGITANAVSQWECDRTAPDISQLPLLARVFNVTTDYLLGVDCEKDKERIDSIMDESFSLYRAGQFKKAAEIARSGLLEFPRSFELMARLADTLVCMSGYEDEVERLCEKILNECTETGPKDHAYRLQIMYPNKDYNYYAAYIAEDYIEIAALYSFLGEYDKTLDALEKMCEYAIRFEHHEGKNSSPAFRGYNEEEWNSDGTHCYCKEKIEAMNSQSSFDALRGDARYIEIIDKLSQYVY